MGFEIKPIKSTKSAKKAVDTKKSTAKKVVKPKPAVKPVVVEEEASKTDVKRVPRVSLKKLL